MENSYQEAFEWIQFSKGRVRYAGGSKGRDEPPIETFAIELNERVHYGEIKVVFLPNGYDFNLEVVSFGWPGKEWSGSVPVPGQCASFSLEDLETVQTLICEAVEVWRTFPTRPFILTEDPAAAFQGDVFFRPGWALEIS